MARLRILKFGVHTTELVRLPGKARITMSIGTDDIDLSINHNDHREIRFI